VIKFHEQVSLSNVNLNETCLSPLRKENVILIHSYGP